MGPLRYSRRCRPSLGRPGLGRPGLGRPGLGRPGLGRPGPDRRVLARVMGRASRRWLVAVAGTFLFAILAGWPVLASGPLPAGACRPRQARPSP